MINEIVLSETIADILAEAITATGRRLGASATATLRGRRYTRDLEIARWFETYRLTEKVPVIPEVPPAAADELAEVLRGDEVQAVLHELLAVRLTDAPDADAARVRAVFDLTLGITGDLAPFTAALFDYYDGEICKLVGALEGHEPALLGQIRSEAMAARMNATLRAIERHTAVLTTRPHQRTESDFLKRYREHVAGHHGMLEPPDLDQRRRVPIDEIYVPPTIEAIGGEQGLPSREIDLRTLAGEIDRTVLLGDPGGGKTTATNVLLHYFAGDSTRPIPFVVTLRDFNPADRSVAGYIEYKLETFYQCPAPPGLVDRLLLTGGAVVVFDGLDELIDRSRRAEMAAIVERFCTEYPHARMLVTSRVVGYDEARLDERQFSSLLKLGSFGNEQVAEYVRKWFFREEDQYELIDRAEAQRSVDAFLDESASVPELRANPMLLSLMCILYRGEGSLPRDRPEVYAKCANLLFSKWDAHRRINVPLRPSLRAPYLLEGILRHLAWWLFTRDQAQSTATERELIEETTSFLHIHRFESEDDAREAASEFVEFSKGRMWVFSETGTTATGERLYSFTHRTFLEYFAAEYLAYSHPKLLDELAGHVARGEWEVVAELAVQMKDRTSAGGAQRIYERLIPLHRPTWRGGHSATLQFLARCLRSVAPPPGTVRELTREILDHLFFSVDGPDEPVWYLPLSWLLANCKNDKTVVHDEISTRIDGMVASGNPKIYLNGLRLAVWLPYSLSAGDAIGNRIFLKNPMRDFWQECAEEYMRTHSNAITKAAADEIGLRRAALTRGLITVDQALRMPGGLPALFLARGTGIFGMARMAYLPAAVIGLVTGRSDLNGSANPDGFAKVIAGFAAFGSYLTECSGPPWPTGPVDDWSEYLWEEPQESSVPRSSLDPIAYFGAAATLLIVAESLVITELPGKGPEQFGPLSDLYPYITRRWGISANGELADLPVPERFRQLFRDWADNKVNFAGPTPASTHD